MKKLFSFVLTNFLIFLVASSIIFADEAADGRKIIDSNKEAVIRIEGIQEMEISFGNETEKSENKVSGSAVIIDQSGLAVTALSCIEGSGYESEYGEESRKSKIIDLKMRLADGTEMPGDVILRDGDLQIAFIKPKTNVDKPLKYVDLTQSSMPQILDSILLMSRLGQVGNRTISATLNYVSAIINKPRTLFAVDGLVDYGGPAFSLDGKVVGIVGIKSNPVNSAGYLNDRYIDVVIPASTILKVAEEAKKLIQK